MAELKVGFLKNYKGLGFGLLAFFLVLFFIPDSMVPLLPRRMAAVAILMAIWWITEALPIPVTALIPIVFFPLLKILPAAKVSINYTHHLIFLFLGGFIIALAIERWNLHKRIALKIIYYVGSNQRLIILGFMLATAFLSMWISNTATTMMMIPIGLAVIARLGNNGENANDADSERNFSLALMLGIAYAASIGGISTIIGTPPNVVFIGILKSNFPGSPEISFLQWMIFALPFSVMFLPMAWFYLVFIAAPVKSASNPFSSGIIREELKSLGPMQRAEKSILVIFVLTGFLWLTRSSIDLGTIRFTGWSALLGLESYVQDSTVAVFMAIVTFMIPSGETEKGRPVFLMNWEWARRVPWGILLLFGGGFALANGFHVSGLTLWLAEQLQALQFLPTALIILTVCALATFTTEFASNTAMASTLLPVLGGMAVAIELNPIILMVPAAISCSTAFMLPIATPPNAIVFASGHIRIRDMVKIGLAMNIVGLILILIIVHLLAVPVFDIDWYSMPAWAR